MTIRQLAFLSGSSAILAWVSMTGSGARAAEVDPSVATLPELVVTAERRSESLQKVPIAATVLDENALAQQGVNRMDDLQRVAPSLSINTYNRSTFINIRGIGIAQSAPSSTPGVAVYINGAFIPHEFTISGAFYDVGSVEVLRGPQGTLTGQNSTGGALYIRTPPPRFNQLSGYVDQTLGDYAWSKTTAAANIPIIEDALALRVAATHEERDSYTKNLGGKTQPGNLNFDGVRGDLRFQANDRLSGDLRAEFFKNDNDYVAVKNRNDLVSKDPFVIEEDAQSSYLARGQRVDLEVKYDIPDLAQVRLISSFQQSLNRDIADGDRTATAPPRNPATNVGRLGYTQTKIKTKTHELDLISPGEGPFKWVLGGFVLNEQLETVLLRWHFDTVVPTRPATNTTLLQLTNETRSVFGQTTYKFSDHWEVLGGLRYSEDEQQFARVTPSAPTGVQKSDQLTGKLALNWFPTERSLVYASLARGYKAGGVNLGATDPNYNPETNTVLELGAKTTLLDGRLRLNGDVYRSNYKDFQLSSLTPARSPITQNIPESKTFGVELEGQAVFGRLNLNLGLSYLDAELDVDTNLLDNTVSPSVLRLVKSGTRMPFAPEWSLNAGVEYNFATPMGLLTPRVQLSYMDTQWAATFQNADSRVPSRTIVDARLTWTPSQAWRVEGSISNLFDKTYIASQLFNTSSADGGMIYGSPRQYGLRVVYRFE